MVFTQWAQDCSEMELFMKSLLWDLSFQTDYNFLKVLLMGCPINHKDIKPFASF